MWSNLNDSFSALTGSINANISTLRQSIPSTLTDAFGDDDNEPEDEADNSESSSREQKTKLDLLRNEVIRHREIALLYKDRWRKAEEQLKSAGAPTHAYEDDLSLLDEPRPILKTTPDLTTVSGDLTDLSEIPLNDDEDDDHVAPNTPNAHVAHGTWSVTSHVPPSITDLALDSATQRITALEDELTKLDTERLHWRTVANQKSNAEEELAAARQQLENATTQLALTQASLHEVSGAKAELETALQELDAQHETSLSSVVRLRDDALGRLQEETAQRAKLQTQLDELQRQLAEAVAAKQTRNDEAMTRQASSSSPSDAAQLIDASLLAKKKQAAPIDAHRQDGTCACAPLLARLRSLVPVELELASLSTPVTTTEEEKIIDVLAGRLADRGRLEVQLELAGAKVREAEGKVKTVQEEAERRLARKDEQLDEIEAENEALAEELEALKKSTRSQAGSRGPSPAPKKDEEGDAQREAELGQAKEELRQAKEELGQAKEELRQAKEELEQAKAVIEELTEQNRLLAEEVKRLGALEVTLNEAKGQSQHEREESDSKLAVKEGTIAKLEGAINELEEQLAASKERFTQVEAEKSALSSQIEELVGRHQAEVSQLKAESSREFEELSEQLFQAKEEAAEETCKAKQQADEFVLALKTTIQELEGKLEDAKAEIAASQQQQVEMASLPDEQREEPEGASTGDALEVTPSQESEETLRLLEEKTEKMREELELAQEEKGKLEGELKIRLEELQSLQIAHAQLRPAYDALVVQYQTLSSEYQTVLGQLTASQASSEESIKLGQAVKHMSVLVQEKDQEVRDLTQKLTSAQESLVSGQAMEERLKTELDRLRAHLVEVEESYTGELMVAQARTQEMTDLVEKMKAEAEAGAQVEEQLKSLRTARDKARNEADKLEDKLASYSTSIANLQGVIEQLEKDHERKLRSLDGDHQAALERERAQTGAVVRKLASQEERLRETLEALEAASRLSETLDQKEFTISQLKRELSNKGAEIVSLHSKIADLEASYEGKVDKQIFKSLLISYFATSAGTQARTEAERLMARFLDFNAQEMERAGIRIGKSANQKDSGSFTFKFVEFLEAESNKKETGTGSQRRDSAASSTSSNAAELARDLNKRLAAGQQGPSSGSGSRPSVLNPFVPHPATQAASVPFGHHRTPSSTSTGSGTSLDHTGNALFAAGTAGLASVLQPAALLPAAASSPSISELVRGAVEKDEVI